MFSHMTFKALPDLASTDLCYPYLLSRHIDTHGCPATANRLLPTLYTGISHPYLGLCSLCLAWDTLPPRPQGQRDLSCNVWLRCSLIDKTLLTAPATENLSFLQTCSAFHVFLSVLIHFLSLCLSCFHLCRPLAPRSLRAASWPGLACRAPCSGKAPGNGAVTVPNGRVLLRSAVPGLCSHSAWRLSSSESSARHRGRFTDHC